MSKSFAWLVWLLTLAFFGCFFLFPIWTVIGGQGGAFVDADGKWTLDYILEVFRNDVYLEGLRNSLALAVASTLATLALALPLALMADRLDFPLKRLLTGALLVPMILPPFVGAIGIRQLLGQQGSLNAVLHDLGLLAAGDTIDWLGHGRFWGIVVLNALHLYPILYLNLTAALANVDPAMEEAAENLGCTGLRKFRRITLPLIMPGLFAGGTIVFIFAFTELGVPLIFDYARVTPVQIFYGLKEIAGNPFPYALVVVMLAATLLAYFASKLAFGRSAHAMMPKAGTASTARRPAFLTRWACSLLFLGITLIALLPHAGVVAVSFAHEWYGTALPTSWTAAHYENALGHTLAVPSILNSLKYASLSTLIDLVLGVAIAYVIVRTRLPGRGLLDALAMLPLAVPGLVLAFGYLAMTQDSRLGDFADFVTTPLGWLCHEKLALLDPATHAAAHAHVLGFAKAHLTVADPTLLLIIAYAVRRLPYVVRSAVAGLQQTSETLEEAAANLGCPPLRTLRRITLPLITANLIAGGLLAFSFAMLEVSDSLVLAQKAQHYPITKAIYELFQLLGEGRFVASALGVWAMVFLGLTILAASRILGKKLGALFRV